MRILITGAEGQLGTAIRNLSVNFSDFEFLFTDINDLDITDWDAVQIYFEKEKPDYIINCAAYTAVDVAEKDDELVSVLNAGVPAFLGKVARNYHCHIIHLSTDYVFDGTNCVPYSEADLVNPESIYGKTKLNGEIGLLKANPSALIIRTSWLYSLTGNNFVNTMIRLGREREVLKVVFDQVGTPTYAVDLAMAILTIVSKTGKKELPWHSGIFHFSNEGVCSWYDFARAIMDLMDISCDVRPVVTAEYPTAAKRPAYSVLNKSKIKRTFGIDIPYWRDSLGTCLKEIR